MSTIHESPSTGTFLPRPRADTHDVDGADALRPAARPGTNGRLSGWTFDAVTWAARTAGRIGP